ncbi:MAG: BamA/TamA family outer membrane protein, partial [Robiginitomaculum sp.]|nr:BamA/TamA family outer membrane protein [Robiginitomaculum sp.]
MNTRHIVYLITASLIAGLLSLIQVHADTNMGAIGSPGIATSDNETLRAAKKKKKPITAKKRTTAQKTKPIKLRQVLPRTNLKEIESLAAYQSASMFVHTIELNGNTVFNADELQTWFMPYQQRKVSSDELRYLADELTQHYIDRGYLNSGVIIPNQEIKNDIVYLQAIEGQLSKIEILGNEKIRTAYIEDHIRVNLSSPLNVVQLKENLQLFERDPHILQINAQLLPSLNRGESILRIKLKEKRPYSFGLQANNFRTPAIGEEQMRINGTYRNLTGRGDQVSVEAGLTQSANELSIRYALPLNANGVNLSIQHARTTGSITLDASGSDDLVITSDAIQTSIGLNYPLIRRLKQSLNAIIRFESKQSQSYLNDIPISFILGEQDGKAQASVLSAGISWNRNFGKQIIAIYAASKIGLNVLDATINDSGADGRFVALQGQTHYLHYLSSSLGQINAKFNWQFSPDQLLALEKFSGGGAASVRGYRENQLLANNGINTSLEWRIPLPSFQYKAYFRKTEIFPFIDQAYIS